MATLKTRKEAGGYQWTHNVEFDFTTLSDEQRTELMEASAGIRWQARARKLSEKELDAMTKDVVKVDALTLFERAAGSRDPLAGIKTAEQATAAIEALAKKLGMTVAELTKSMK